MRATRGLVVSATAVAALGFAAPMATAGGDDVSGRNSNGPSDAPVSPGRDVRGGSVATMPADMNAGAGLVLTAAVGTGVFLVRRRMTGRAGA
ncbi:hypothetical protein [Streptomyces sp. NPDC006510]|uniref:hypothetical protein n=1 Tax=Streptomyces sp. NPDC006510 TaxID=3155600 RepID=UPI0033B92848